MLAADGPECDRGASRLSAGETARRSPSGKRAYLKPVRVRLSAKERGGEYLLEVVAKAIEPVKECELSITSRVVETDSRGRQTSERIIFQGRGRRECGE